MSIESLDRSGRDRLLGTSRRFQRLQHGAAIGNTLTGDGSRHDIERFLPERHADSPLESESRVSASEIGKAMIESAGKHVAKAGDEAESLIEFAEKAAYVGKHIDTDA